MALQMDRILLESGAHPEDVDNAGRTPLLTACECNHLAAAEVLLTLTPPSSFNCHSPSCSDTPGSLASVDAPPRIAGHPPTGFAIVNATGGAPHVPITHVLNRPSLDNQTPLRAAALCDNPELVRMLLAAGADPDYQVYYQNIESCLCIAMSYFLFWKHKYGPLKTLNVSCDMP